MHPARVWLVPGVVMTSMRSKPSAPMRNSVTPQEWPWPSCEAITARPPNQVCACAIKARSSDKSASSITSSMADTVRPGMLRSHSGATASAGSNSGSLAPSSALSGSGWTMESG